MSRTLQLIFRHLHAVSSSTSHGTQPQTWKQEVQRSERNIDIIWAVVVGKLRQGALALSPDSSGASHVQIIIIMTRQRLS